MPAMIRLRHPQQLANWLGFTADGRHLVVARVGYAVAGACWLDWAEGAVAHQIVHEHDAVGFSPDATYFASTHDDRRRGTVHRGWAGEPVAAFKPPRYFTDALAVAPDGSEVALTAPDRLHVHALPSGAVVARQPGRLSEVHYSPGGRWLVGRYGMTAHLFDRHRRFAPLRLPAVCGGVAAVAPDDATAATVGESGKTVVLWDLPGGTERSVLRGPRRTIQALTFAPDGRRVLAGGAYGTVWVWDTATGACLRTYDWGIKTVESVAWSPDGTTCAAARIIRSEVVVWDVEG